MARVTLGLIQTAVGAHPLENIKKATDKIRLAAAQGAQIICLQELFSTPYFPREEKGDFTALAHTIPSLFSKQFSALAKELRAVLIIPFYEKNPGKKGNKKGGKKGNSYYNSALVFDADGKMLPTYRKHHIPHDPLFYEKNYFKESTDDYPVYRTKYAPFSVLICYDQWFPEAARICALKGAEILFYPTAIGFISGHEAHEGDWHDAWETIQRSHAIANSVAVAAVNRTGDEGELHFWGGSFACDSFGNVLKRAGEKEEVIVVDVDLSRNKSIRDSWGFMRNRRPDSYARLCKK